MASPCQVTDTLRQVHRMLYNPPPHPEYQIPIRFALRLAVYKILLICHFHMIGYDRLQPLKN